MFVDEITIYAKAGRGGNGVVRWRHEKFVDKGGPAGGNGGRGGDVYMRAVRDMNLLARYTGSKDFKAEEGTAGDKSSRHGSAGEDFYIDVPVGARVTDISRQRVFTFDTEGEIHKILKGGSGGLGNEHFKTSVNRSPDKSTLGRAGESGDFLIELSLIVDVGIIGFPNAGKSTLLNALTKAKSRIGAYPFTTVEPHLGDLYGYTLADIPGLIEGASKGKGLGHKFLRHTQRTKMLLHCISLEEEDIVNAYKTIRKELGAFDGGLLEKEEWVVLTKTDLVTPEVVEEKKALLGKLHAHISTVSALDDASVKTLQDTLTAHLAQENA